MTQDLEALVNFHRWWRDVGNDLLLIGVLAEFMIDVFWPEQPESFALLRGRKATTPLAKWNRHLLTTRGIVVVLVGLAVFVGIGLERWQGNKADEVVDQIRAEQQSRIAGRTLTLDQQRSIRSAMNAFTDEHAVIALYAGDPESFIFALQIKAAIGPLWSISDPNSILVAGSGMGMAFGVWVAATADDKSQRAARALVAGLAGFDAKVNPTIDKHPGRELSIFVGPRQPLLLSGP